MAAVTDAYATAAEYRAAIKKTDSTVDAAILVDLKAVSRYIEAQTRRFFTQDAAAVARIYYPRQAGRRLRVDDIGSVTNLSIKRDTDRDGSYSDETAFASTDYELWPLNADKGPEPQPWDEIVLPFASTQSPFSCDIPVQVTAIWGWPAVPPAIKRACIELTGILRLESPRASRTMNLSINEVVSTSRQAQDIVSALVQSYAHVVFA